MKEANDQIVSNSTLNKPEHESTSLFPDGHVSWWRDVLKIHIIYGR